MPTSDAKSKLKEFLTLFSLLIGTKGDDQSEALGERYGMPDGAGASWLSVCCSPGVSLVAEGETLRLRPFFLDTAPFLVAAPLFSFTH